MAAAYAAAGLSPKPARRGSDEGEKMAGTQQVVVITGANSGIGKAAALRFAAEGDRVVMACRDPDRGERARREIAAAANGAEVEVMQLDVSSFASVRAFCAAFKAAHPRLDVLIHNAGYFSHGLKTYQLSDDGLELTFATNVFGPVLMTRLLLEALARSDDARVLFAASTNLKHFFDPARTIEFDNLRGEFRRTRPYTVYKMYGDSKMAVVLLARRMAAEYAPMGVKVNAIMIPATRVEPATLKKFTGGFRLVAPLVQNLNPLALQPSQVADAYYRICASEPFREVAGALIDARLRVIAPAAHAGPLGFVETVRELLDTRHLPAYACDPGNIERIWRLSLEVTGEAPAP